MALPQHPLVGVITDMMPILIRAAKRDANVDAYVDGFLELVDDEQLDEVEQMATTAPVLDILAPRFPEVIAFRPWFQRFLDELKAAIQTMDMDGDDGDTPAEPVQH